MQPFRLNCTLFWLSYFKASFDGEFHEHFRNGYDTFWGLKLPTWLTKNRRNSLDNSFKMFFIDLFSFTQCVFIAVLCSWLLFNQKCFFKHSFLVWPTHSVNLWLPNNLNTQLGKNFKNVRLSWSDMQLSAHFWPRISYARLHFAMANCIVVHFLPQFQVC